MPATTLQIASRSLSTLIGNQSQENVAALFRAAKETGVEYNLAFIEPSVASKSSEPFDPVYMRAL